jgi:protoporphyrinogen IX oxidase
MSELLANLHPWTKALHVISFVAWMAGLFYLPRLFVYHVETTGRGEVTDPLFQTMERKLLKLIMTPAMIATWFFGLVLIGAGAVDWSAGWPYAKAAGVIGMTWFHMWCAAERRRLAEGASTRPGRFYRKMNEVPTVLLVLIVVSVVARPF